MNRIVRETLSRFSFLAPEWKKAQLEIRQADPNWIKSIWILLSLLFPQCTQYYPPFPVTVSWAVCITQLHINKKKNPAGLQYRFLCFNNWAANAEQWRPVPVCAVESAPPIRPAHGAQRNPRPVSKEPLSDAHQQNTNAWIWDQTGRRTAVLLPHVI